jgi:hypothetical protein
MPINTGNNAHPSSNNNARPSNNNNAHPSNNNNAHPSTNTTSNNNNNNNSMFKHNKTSTPFLDEEGKETPRNNNVSWEGTHLSEATREVSMAAQTDSHVTNIRVLYKKHKEQQQQQQTRAPTQTPPTATSTSYADAAATRLPTTSVLIPNFAKRALGLQSNEVPALPLDRPPMGHTMYAQLTDNPYNTVWAMIKAEPRFRVREAAKMAKKLTLIKRQNGNPILIFQDLNGHHGKIHRERFSDKTVILERYVEEKLTEDTDLSAAAPAGLSVKTAYRIQWTNDQSDWVYQVCPAENITLTNRREHKYCGSMSAEILADDAELEKFRKAYGLLATRKQRPPTLTYCETSHFMDDENADIQATVAPLYSNNRRISNVVRTQAAHELGWHLNQCGSMVLIQGAILRIEAPNAEYLDRAENAAAQFMAAKHGPKASCTPGMMHEFRRDIPTPRPAQRDDRATPSVPNVVVIAGHTKALLSCEEYRSAADLCKIATHLNLQVLSAPADKTLIKQLWVAAQEDRIDRVFRRTYGTFTLLSEQKATEPSGIVQGLAPHTTTESRKRRDRDSSEEKTDDGEDSEDLDVASADDDDDAADRGSTNADNDVAAGGDETDNDAIITDGNSSEPDPDNDNNNNNNNNNANNNNNGEVVMTKTAQKKRNKAQKAQDRLQAAARH